VNSVAGNKCASAASLDHHDRTPGATAWYSSSVPWNSIGRDGAGSVITLNDHDDVVMFSPHSTDIVVVSNLVCTGAADERVLPSAREGIFLDAEPDHAIGDTRFVPGKVFGGAFAGDGDAIPG
jgi:hypothetical protein